MPHAEDLPALLAPLARRNATELSDRRWDYDAAQLISVLEAALTPPTGAVEPAPPTVPVQRASSVAPKVAEYARRNWVWSGSPRLRVPAGQGYEKVDRRTWRWHGTVPLDVDAAAQRIASGIERLGIAKAVEQNGRSVHAKGTPSFLQHMAEIWAELEPQGKEQTGVMILSQSLEKRTLHDMGKNRHNLERIVALLQEEDGPERGS
jgi:hypothetical protein